GLLFYFLIFILHSFDLITISVDTSLQSLFMLVFFTTVGLGASFKLIKLGGKLLIIYLLAASFLSLVQNTLCVSIATLLGIETLSVFWTKDKKLAARCFNCYVARY